VYTKILAVEKETARKFFALLVQRQDVKAFGALID
jgi:hypothetical protein